MRRRTRIALLVAAAVLAVPLLAALAIAIWGWNWARPIVARQVTARTGRSCTIAGDLDVDLGWHPVVTAANVTLGNARWGSQPALFAADRLRLRFPLAALVHRRFALDELGLDHATLVLERSADGVGNWVFERRVNAHGKGAPIFPATATITKSRFLYLDHAADRAVEVLLDRARSAGGLERPMGVLVEGLYRGEPFAVRGSLGTLADLRGENGRPAPVHLVARAGDTRARVDGTAADPPLDGLDVRLALAGPSLDRLWPFTGLPLPASPPYEVAGRLLRAGDRWSYRGFDGTLGRSDLHGDLAVRLPAGAGDRGGRRLVTADVRSRRVDLADVSGFWGKAPRTQRAPGGPIFSDQPFAFAKLGAVDAEVRFRAAAVRGLEKIDSAAVAFTLDRGRLTLHPLELGFAGGSLDARGTLDARRTPARFDGDVVLRRLQLARLFASAGHDNRMQGTAGGRAAIHTRGNSLHQMAANLDGEVGVLMQHGEVGEVFVELVGLDLGEAAIAKLWGNHPAPIDCMVGVFDVENGTARARSLLFDNADTRVTGEGTVDLARERIDLRLEPHPKDVSILSFRTPITIEGTLAEHHVRPEKKKLFVRAGAALALGVFVNPLAALVPLVELGQGEKPGACSAALAQYREVAAKPAPRSRVAHQERRRPPAGGSRSPGAPAP